MFPFTRKITITTLCFLLVACGGGSSDSGTSTSGAAGSPQFAPTVWTSEGRYYNSCSEHPVCSGNPYAPFSAAVRAAPADGATISGIVRLEVRGIVMKNVELLPASGYTPLHGKFRLTGDGVLAWMDLDTTRLPNGPISLRISAYDVGPGQPGAREIVAMAPRTWTINNVSVPPGGFAASLGAAPANGATVSGIVRLTVQGSGLANVELIPGSAYSPRLGVFNVSADRTQAWLDFDTRSVPDGARSVRIAAYNVMEGQAAASQIIAMPARSWTVNNGTVSLPAFTSATAMAPPHGAAVSGRITLEVRGSGMRNVELVPATGYVPIYRTLGESGNAPPDSFYMVEVDTRTLPNGPFDARMLAFDVEPGQSNAREIVTMPARTWIISN